MIGSYATNDFLWWVSTVSSFAGIASLVLGIITMINTLRINKKLLQQIEGNNFLAYAKESIDKFRSYHESIKGDGIYNEQILLKIQEDIDELTINYSSIFSQKLRTEIRKLENLTETGIKRLSDKEVKNMICRDLNKLTTMLEKLKSVRENIR